MKASAARLSKYSAGPGPAACRRPRARHYGYMAYGAPTSDIESSPNSVTMDPFRHLALQTAEGRRAAAHGARLLHELGALEEEDVADAVLEQARRLDAGPEDGHDELRAPQSDVKRSLLSQKRFLARKTKSA